MAKKDNKGISVSKSENIVDWYSEILQKAELADYSPVKGFMVVRPRAYYIWEKIQGEFNKVLESKRVMNAYFPLLIPESFFKKEAEHAEGFSPELAYIENSQEDGEKLALRPTSETIMYDSYSKWIRSWRDLPLKINQWCNVVRWEVKQTKPFLRTREFLWQEGHCVFETEKEAEENMREMIEEYEKLVSELLAVPVLVGRKSKMETFAGAERTMTIEAFMPDGKALQAGTSHNLGQGFAKSFGISFKDKDENDAVPWQTSWGFSTRLIGALIMLHGDDKGLVLPPKVAREKAVIVPIFKEDSREKILEVSEKLAGSLGDYGAFVDSREEYSPGWKFNEWEMKGVPLRIELGPKDVEKSQAVLVRRDTGEKEIVSLNKIKDRVSKLLDEIQQGLFDRAEKMLKSKIDSASSLMDLKKKIDSGKLVKVYMKDSSEVEGELKDKTEGATSRFIEDVSKDGKCIISGESVKTIAYVSRSY